MEKYSNKYPQLYQMFMYFYWTTDLGIARTIDQIISAYIDQSNKDQLKQSVEDLDSLIKEDLSEEALKSVIKSLGCDIDILKAEYNATAQSHKDWLCDIQVILQNELHRRNKLVST